MALLYLLFLVSYFVGMFFTISTVFQSYCYFYIFSRNTNMLPIFFLMVPFLTYSFLNWLYVKVFKRTQDVNGKIVLITGASGGLGEACAKRFFDGGAKVVLCARNHDQLKRVKREINPDEASIWPVILQMDVTDPHSVKTCVESLHQDHGEVDILISNAGMSQRGSVEDTLIDVHKAVMAVNYFGPVQLVKEILPFMLKRCSGHIVSIGSVQAKIAIPFRSAYSASKHANQAFFDSLRAEVARSNIDVTMINPGYIRTRMSINALSPDASKHGVLDATTAAGMGPAFVANHIFDSIEHPVNEVTLADMQSNFAVFIRYMFPSVYFQIIKWKANSEWRKQKKIT